VKDPSISSISAPTSQLTTINPLIPKRELHIFYGSTPALTYQRDKRFSYFLYVPHSHKTEPRADGYPLVVLMHGTARQVEGYRSGFVDFAEREQVIILLPLFPVGVTTALDVDEYKRMEHGGIRYDETLLGMVDEVSTMYRVRGKKFLLHGFSGGGQFVHRFLYLHPEHLAGISIGAPGSVTLLDESRPWWVGVGGITERFGIELDSKAIAAVPVLLVVGELDTEPAHVLIDRDEPSWMEGINDSGRTRRERITALQRSLEAIGASTRLVVVPNVAHEGLKVFAPVIEFFSGQLRG
jgi:poly(3-hydroxybutyrate) depolymerase